MRSAISFLLIVAAAQLSCLTVEAFSMLQATRVIAPSKAKQARAAPAAAKKPAAKKKVKVTGKTDAKAKPKAAKVSASKAKATTAAKAKVELKAKTKAKAEAKLKANAAVRTKNKTVEAAKTKAAAQAKAKSLEKAKKAAAAKKKNIRTTTSATAAQVGNSGTDAALAITKNFKPKKDKTNLPLFPGLQGAVKKASSAKKADTPAKANTVLAKKANSPSSTSGAVNPIEFGIQVVQSEKGQEAASILIEGGLKLVEAILAEGKKSKVVIPRGFDAGTGDLKQPRVENIGYKQLLDAGIFAGTEFFDVASKNYEKFYVGSEGKALVKVTRTEAKIDRVTGKVLTPVKENYFVNIGGERVLINRRL